MAWLRNAPTPVVITVIISAGLGTLAVLAGYVALDLAGEETGNYLTFVSALVNLILLPLMGVSTLASASAARSAAAAEHNTNGQLTRRDEEIATLRAALTDQEGAR